MRSSGHYVSGWGECQSGRGADQGYRPTWSLLATSQPSVPSMTMLMLTAMLMPTLPSWKR
jgi:hypothetical protein